MEPVSGGLTGQLRSLSMTEAIPSPSAAEAPFNMEFQRNYRTDGIAGEELQVFESEFVLDPQNRVARFRVMGNRTELENEIGCFQRRLFTYLSVFGVGMIAINAVAILLGLRPLARVRAALALVREGTAKRLDGAFPAEIEPLANETNALIENNKRIVERSRTQVGNLAHSLKTPLAVLLNEGRIAGRRQGQADRDAGVGHAEQVEHYLQRARVAAQRDSVVYRTPLSPSLKRMVRVMEKLNPRTRVSLDLPAEEVVVCRRARGSRGDRRQPAGKRDEMGGERGARLGQDDEWTRIAARACLHWPSRMTGRAFPRTRRARR